MMEQLAAAIEDSYVTHDVFLTMLNRAVGAGIVTKELLETNDKRGVPYWYRMVEKLCSVEICKTLSASFSVQSIPSNSPAILLASQSNDATLDLLSSAKSDRTIGNIIVSPLETDSNNILHVGTLSIINSVLNDIPETHYTTENRSGMTTLRSQLNLNETLSLWQSTGRSYGGSHSNEEIRAPGHPPARERQHNPPLPLGLVVCIHPS